MKRSELTVAIMKDRGWMPCNANDLRLKDIVFNIQECWKYLRCTKSTGTYTENEYNMCSTYRVRYAIEYLEVSMDNINWFKVAERPVEVGRTCIYAD